jgi:hypothetical protein
VHAERAHRGMSFAAGRLLSGYEDDFVYLTLRGAEQSGEGTLRFALAPGGQPEPLSIPGVLQATRRLGELEVRVLLFEPGRVDWILRAGRDEPSAALGRPKKVALGPELLPRSLAAIGLGHTTEALRYGLGFEGQASLDLRRPYATVVLRAEQEPRVLPPGEAASLGATDDAVQLPLLADGGRLLPGGSDRGPMRQRGALCVSGSGRTLIALARHDSSDPLVSTLLEAGCSRVVGLDRGSRHAAFVHRAGTDAPPEDAYPVTVLHAVARPMIPPAGLF